MQSFKTFLAERYVNLFDASKKQKYAADVWKLLQASYAEIGGIHGNGFSSIDDMIKNIPMWKVLVRNGKVIAAAMYKDSDGRKRVAIGTDGSMEARTQIRAVVKADLDRAYVEMSDRSFFSLLKGVGEDFMKQYIKTVSEAEKILGQKLGAPNKNDPIYEKVPGLRPYMYSRTLGGHVHTKVLLGTTGKKIIH